MLMLYCQADFAIAVSFFPGDGYPEKGLNPDQM
jgi:hypothetical protein